jgi:putative photosynthetic complex assembly protein
MNEPERKSPFPRGALIGAGVLIGCTMALVAVWRLGDIEPAASVESPDQPVASVALRFEDRPNGEVVVYQAGTGAAPQAVAVLQRGEDGFMRGVLRALTRAREARGIGREQPFRLLRRDDGALLLEDPATDQRVFLQAFGPTNVKAFERLLADKGSTP